VTPSSPFPAEERSFTPAEAAKALGLSRSTVQRAVASGDLRAYRRGDRHRIPESALVEFRQAMFAQTAEASANDF
jgi:excisionase family DNA binding protein